jgi:RHS repeat-associated protein
LNASGTPLSPQTSTLNSRYSYTGREWDATVGLYHFRARWMSGFSGRFLTRDPIGYRADDDLYEYVGSDPLRMVDPRGLMANDVPFNDPPTSPRTGSCKIQVRCWTIFTSQHCGLVIDNGDGTYATIDGTGGGRNAIDWVEPIDDLGGVYHPIGKWGYGPKHPVGPWVNYDPSTCECSFGCNSNTT